MLSKITPKLPYTGCVTLITYRVGHEPVGYTRSYTQANAQIRCYQSSY